MSKFSMSQTQKLKHVGMGLKSIFKGYAGENRSSLKNRRNLEDNLYGI